MLPRAAMLPGLMFTILLVLSTAPTGSSSSRLRGKICSRPVSQVITYLQPVRYTQLVRTRKCTFLIFCKTAYRTSAAYRMERKTKTTYKMMVECCEGHHEVNGVCVPDSSHHPHSLTTPRDYSYISTSDMLPSSDEVPTSTAVQQRTIPDDPNQRVGVGSQTSTWIFKDTTEPILIGKNKELHITDSNQATLIMAFIGCILSVFIIIVVIVIYRRRKKAAKYIGEIPYTPDVLPFPSKSKKDCSAPEDSLNYRNFPPTDENFYMSMDSGCQLQVPSVKMMLATRGSGYRFSGLDEETRRRADTLYMTPDSAAYNNHDRKANVAPECQEPKFPRKVQQDNGCSEIYINGQDINLDDEDEENIYSEIKAKTLKRTDPGGDENAYSFIRMECVKEPAPEETECEAETSLYSSLHECEDGNSNEEMETVLNSKQTSDTKGDKYDSLTQTKRRSNCGRQGEVDEVESRDDACDSGIYTSINLDSDKDDEANPDATYDQPKKKAQIDGTKRNEAGSDFYENFRRNSDESNYDIPRTQQNNEEDDAIYSDISPSSQITNTPVVARNS